MFVFNSIIHNTVQGGDDLQTYFILCVFYLYTSGIYYILPQFLFIAFENQNVFN